MLLLSLSADFQCFVAIVVQQQALHAAAPTDAAQFAHHLSLLTHKADTQKRDSLSYLTKVILACRDSTLPLPQPASLIIPKVQPLISHTNDEVRKGTLRLLQALPKEDVKRNAESLLLHVMIGMKQLARANQLSGLQVLEWLMHTAGEGIVSAPGGWWKTLRQLCNTLRWRVDDKTAKLVVTQAVDNHLYTAQLNALGTFLEAGFRRPPPPSEAAWVSFPLWHTEAHLLPSDSNCFRHLQLFGPPRSPEDEMYSEVENRVRVFKEEFLGTVEQGLEGAKKMGGEIGRSAAMVRKILKEGMKEG